MGWEKGTDGLVGKPIDNIKDGEEILGKSSLCDEILGNKSQATRDIIGMGDVDLTMGSLIGMPRRTERSKKSAPKAKRRNSNRANIQRSGQPPYPRLPSEPPY